MQPRVSAGSSINELLRLHSGSIVALLCLYAGVRIFVFAAAFPLFNNVDEQSHLMSIQMYARGEWPGKELPHIDAESAKFYALYGSPEYLVPKEWMTGNTWIPFYQLPPQEAYSRASRAYFHYLYRSNFEAQSPPLYYLLGAGWYRIGAASGMRDWELAYWVRFLNPFAYMVLVWASYRFVRKAYPDRIFLWLGVPGLLAVFPQDVYFGLNRDVLSAPMAAVALLLMVNIVDEEKPARWLLIAASLFVGFTFLVNVSNCVLYGALALALWFWARKSTAASAMKMWVGSGSVFASLLPPALWMLRNHAIMGDFTGSRAKVEALGWTLKPLSEIFNHPLFSATGFDFLKDLCLRFWRGEYVWHMEPMRWRIADWFYLISSAAFIVAFMVNSIRRWKRSTLAQRFAEIQAPLLVFTSVLFMAVISLPFDFHNCPYPSREYPFFVSGRIISGALLPFVIIYVGGMDALLTRVRKWMSPAAILACLMVFITITEFQVRRVVFSRPDNFFAIREWQQKH